MITVQEAKTGNEKCKKPNEKLTRKHGTELLARIVGSNGVFSAPVLALKHLIDSDLIKPTDLTKQSSSRF